MTRARGFTLLEVMLAIVLMSRQAIRQALQATKGNKTEAARRLRTDYKTLHLKIKQHGIDAGRFRKLRAS